MVPFFDVARMHQPLLDELTDAFHRVVGHGRFILGPEVEAFEKGFASHIGVDHAIGVSSGTDALLAVLMALDVGPGDEVIVPTLTFFATAGAVARLGATPVFVDVDEDTLLMDTDQALAAVSPRTRAIIPVQLFGQCVSLPMLASSGVPLIEDAAQSHAARDERGVPCGAQGFAGCFSFFPTKPLGGLGDGGMVTTNDEAFADRVRLLRTHGARPKFHHIAVGGNFRLDALQAALLHVKLCWMEEWAVVRRRIHQRYVELLAPAVKSGDIQFLGEAPGTHVYHQHVVRVQQRDRLRSGLRAKGIGTALYYPEPLHTQPCFTALNPPALPIAERACSEVLALPCFPGLREDEIAEVANAMCSFFGV